MNLLSTNSTGVHDHNRSDPRVCCAVSQLAMGGKVGPENKVTTTSSTAGGSHSAVLVAAGRVCEPRLSLSALATGVPCNAAAVGVSLAQLHLLG